MSVVPPKVDASLKIAQITSLIKDNQLVTALIVFLLWQAGAIASAGTYLGGVC